MHRGTPYIGTDSACLLFYLVFRKFLLECDPKHVVGRYISEAMHSSTSRWHSAMAHDT